MHSLVEVPVGSNGGTHVPAFLAKLWKIVDDPSTNDLICWNEVGNSFIIKNQAKFARDLLPLYYKHNNMASFVRQLNMYGFHKVVSVEQGGLRVDKDEMEFAHPFFLKGQEASLELIKRKIPASKHEESKLRPDSFNKVLMDVRQMKGRQESMDNRLVTMKRENEALWRELASLRQKHAKQTQIVSKLLQFLVGVMSQQTPRLAFKRRMPLMLSDKDGVSQKFSRTDVSESTGPVIHDVTELLQSDDSGEDVEEDYEILPDNGIAESSLSVASGNPGIVVISPSTTMESATVPATTTTTTVAQLQQPMRTVEQNKSVKGKMQLKKNSPATSTFASIKTEPSASFQAAPAVSTAQNYIQVQPQQIVQIPGITTSINSQAQNSVPPTLYFTAPGMTDPVQLVLAIPDQAQQQQPSSGVPVPFNTATSTVVSNMNVPVGSNGLNIQQEPSVNTTTTTSTTTPTPFNKTMLNSLVQELNHTGGKNQSSDKSLVQSNGKVVHRDLDGHLEEVDMELNHLRDLFKSNQFHFDNDTLAGLFGIGHHIDNAENEGAVNPLPQMSADGGGNSSSQGQEVVTYNPSLFELAEDDSNFFDESSNMFLDDELESMLTTPRDTLKRPEVGQLSFAGINPNNSSLQGELNTPIEESLILPGTSTMGANKRKRK